ncbi:hypothetical protein CRG98_042623 [Punica granatum]|uniref:Uncharacterized protein n=1 Tax=Punica granatum TaxID=22663 RepID=A0A2I0HZ74_PUNGR|nr:hypothetical protein CRG98_042623 [Punica granatum]
MATTKLVGKAWKQATSAYRRELGLAWLVVPAHSISPACWPDLKNSWAGRPAEPPSLVSVRRTGQPRNRLVGMATLSFQRLAYFSLLARNDLLQLALRFTHLA